MQTKVVSVVGLPGVGKTHLCKFLTQRYAARYYDSGKYIKDEVKRRGLPFSRTTITDVAMELRELGGEDESIRILKSELADLSELPQIVVVEGLRWPGQLKQLIRTWGSSHFLIYLEAPIEVRHRRACQKRTERKLDEINISLAEFRLQELLPTEKEVPKFRALGDAITNTDRPIEETRNEVVRLFELWGIDAPIP